MPELKPETPNEMRRYADALRRREHREAEIARRKEGQDSRCHCKLRVLPALDPTASLSSTFAFDSMIPKLTPSELPPEFPSRIVCLTDETTETLYLLGEQDRIVGVSGFSTRPPRSTNQAARFGFSRRERRMPSSRSGRILF